MKVIERSEESSEKGRKGEIALAAGIRWPHGPHEPHKPHEPHDFKSHDESHERITEGVNPRSSNLDLRTTIEILSIMNQEDNEVPRAVALELPEIAAAVDAIVSRLRAGGRLVYAGAGTSGRMAALDALEIPPTFGVDPGIIRALVAGGPAAFTRPDEAAEDDFEAGKRDVEELVPTRSDVVMGIAAGGRTPYVLGAMKAGRSAGSFVIGLACNRGTPMEGIADLMIRPIVGPEIITGSTRLKAGTAQKLVLNMISTAVMTRLGLVYDGFMIGMRPVNSKLWERARSIVASISGVGEVEAGAALNSAGGDIRVAVLQCMGNMDVEDARQLLASSGGNLREALTRINGEGNQREGHQGKGYQGVCGLE
ncbi:MAG: N-acetylmuramic acid 6-phosphate etherase [Firmicutes bacterium]|nr:N-acetylmuramic acid 6-phosphate etherase [Bacillota bacterium]